MVEPLWRPSSERIERANMSRFIRFVDDRYRAQVLDYPALYNWSVRQSGQFWCALWEFCGIRASGELVPTVENPERMPGARWFPQVRLNFAQNLLRYRDDRVAMVFRGEAGERKQWTYAELASQVAELAACLRSWGVGRGDRVAGFMPNIGETVVAMLATTSLGAVWSSCSPDFGAQGVLDRFGQIQPKVLFTADAYAYGGKQFNCLSKIAELLPKLPSIEKVVVVAHLTSAPDLSTIANAVHYADAKVAGVPLTFEAVAFDHPLYIMYSSGTTGVPKCIVHGVGGTLIQHLKELVLHVDLKREDHLLFYTTCGWMMWNWMVSALSVGATLVLYDGSPSHPSPAVLWNLVEEEKVSVFGTSAKWLSASEKAELKPRETHKLLHLRTLLSTGSPLSDESFEYVYRDVKSDLLLASISGGTDIISCFALGNPLLPVYRGELQCRGLGMKVEILDDAGKAVREQKGELSCTQTFPCMPIGFYNDADGAKYRAAYFEKFPDVWCHGDHAMLTEHEGIVIYGRSDATLNPGGVRIGTAEIYRQVEKLPEVMESLAIGQEWESDIRVVLFVRLREGVTLDAELIQRIKSTIRNNTTPRHVPAKVIAVPDMPRTISGKLTELAVRNVVHGLPVKNTDALANPQALAHFANLAELQTG